MPSDISVSSHCVLRQYNQNWNKTILCGFTLSPYHFPFFLSSPSSDSFLLSLHFDWQYIMMKNIPDVTRCHECVANFRKWDGSSRVVKKCSKKEAFVASHGYGWNNCPCRRYSLPIAIFHPLTTRWYCHLDTMDTYYYRGQIVPLFGLSDSTCHWINTLFLDVLDEWMFSEK